MESRGPSRKGSSRSRRSDRPKSPAVGERLREDVCERENCQQALARVKANKGSPGLDGMTVHELHGYLKQHWPMMREHRARSSTGS